MLDIRYSTADNFTKEVLYDNSICLLRKGTVDKLFEANKKLSELGYCIKIWDAFRPVDAQRKMWSLVPDERFVADSDKGKINHCKGSSVDVTLCDLNGNEIKMPTEFDHLGEESFRDYYSNLDEETKKM